MIVQTSEFATPHSVWLIPCPGSSNKTFKSPIEEHLRAHLVGQNCAVHAAVAAVRRKETGWLDDDHPLVLLSLGPSGVGKSKN